MADETAWLIERADPKAPECVMLDSFLGILGSYNGYKGGGMLTWLPNASDALRFARHKDAAMFIGMMEQLHDGMPHGWTLPGLRNGDPKALVVEHAWVDPAHR